MDISTFYHRPLDEITLLAISPYMDAGDCIEVIFPVSNKPVSKKRKGMVVAGYARVHACCYTDLREGVAPRSPSYVDRFNKATDRSGAELFLRDGNYFRDERDFCCLCWGMINTIPEAKS
jgi:hypothetical protein